jgi:hypothetical protein
MCDSKGNFEFYTIPGPHYLDTYIGISRISSNFILTEDDTEKEVDLHGNSDSPLPAALHGRVVLADKPDQGVPEILLTGHPVEELSGDLLGPDGTTDRNGNFEIRASKSVMYLVASTRTGNLAGILRVDPNDQNVTLSIAPTATAHGRLLDPQGHPIPNKQLSYMLNFRRGQPTSTTFYPGNKTTTAADGTFSFPGFIPAQTYILCVLNINSDGNRSYDNLTTFTPTSATPINLGDLSHPTPTTAP